MEINVRNIQASGYAGWAGPKPGMVVTVEFSDGSKENYIRTHQVGSLQWAAVPGTFVPASGSGGTGGQSGGGAGTSTGNLGIITDPCSVKNCSVTIVEN